MRAEHFRRANDFDRAIAAYEAIVQEDSTDAEAYWGIVISRFGIEYVEDPATHERIPTCHRVQYESILADPDYKAALENAGGAERDVYEKEAQRIAEIQKDILAVSSREQPFDVFICYKEKTDGGSRTKDSAIAQDIYYQLTAEGYNVFFARITLEDKLGEQYEPYIFAALNSAKVMLVLGSKKEYFNAVWVRNEWSRFLQLMKKDRSKLLIPCYRDMDVYEIPDELSMFQCQDMSKIGFMQNLLQGIKKVVDTEDQKSTSPSSASNAAAAALMRRVELFLKGNEYDSALEYCERIIDQEPENCQVYIYRLMAENKISEEGSLFCVKNDLASQKSYQLAMQFADAEQKQRLQEFVSKQKNEKIYLQSMEQLREIQGRSFIKDDIAQLRKLEVYFTAIGEHRDAQEQVKLIKKLLQVKYDEAVQRMSQKSKQPRKYKALANLFSEFIGYFDDAEIRYKQCRKKTLILAYNRIFERTKRAKHAGDYASAIVSLSRLCENPHCTSEIYAHCQELIQRCDEGIKKPKYDQEKKFIDKRKFSDAINLLVEITDYLDSGQKLEFCQKRLAQQKKRRLTVALIFLVPLAVLSVSHSIYSHRRMLARNAKYASDIQQKAATVSLDLGSGVMLALILVQPGSFLMGSERGDDDEAPVHEVTISQPFYLGKYEVTQAQWKKVMGSSPSRFKGANRPVEQVSWYDCQEFIEKLNSKGNGVFRLPTEAEWEYACRAGTTDDYAGNLDEMGWYDKNNVGKTQPVGKKKANPWGLYDMHGNVSEWCQDWHSA